MEAEFWLDVRERIRRVSRIDSRRDIVFGSNYHNYKVIKPLSEKWILRYEEQHQLRLPDDYRSFLIHFGAGGAGPDYGIYDFKKAGKFGLEGYFPHSESMPWPDDDPLCELPGLLTISTSGCAIDWYIEISGKQPGTMWVDSGSGSELTKNLIFSDWYLEWLKRIEKGVFGYEAVKSLVKKRAPMSAFEDIFNSKAKEVTLDNTIYFAFEGIGALILFEGTTSSGMEKCPLKIS